MERGSSRQMTWRTGAHDPAAVIGNDSQKRRALLFGDWGQAQTWKKVLPPGSRASADGGGRANGFTDEARHVECTSEDVGQEGGLGSVGHAEPRGTFHAAAGLASIAAPGIREFQKNNRPKTAKLTQKQNADKPPTAHENLTNGVE